MQYFCVTIPPAVKPTLLRQMDMGSLTCAHCVPCTRRRVMVSHKQVCTRGDSGGDRKTVPHPASPGDRTQGLQIRIPDALTSELCPLAKDLIINCINKWHEVVLITSVKAETYHPNYYSFLSLTKKIVLQRTRLQGQSRVQIRRYFNHGFFKAECELKGVCVKRILL